jgi:hypothetical protein
MEPGAKTGPAVEDQDEAAAAEEHEEDDSWEAAGEIPGKDINQSPAHGRSDAEDEAGKLKQLDEAWVSEDSYEKYLDGDSREEEQEPAAARPAKKQEKQRPSGAAVHKDEDEADLLAVNLMDLERRLARYESITELEMQNKELHDQLEAKEKELQRLKQKYQFDMAARDEKIESLRKNQVTG